MNGAGTLIERLDKIRSQPKLESQQQTAVVLRAIEDTLDEQKSDRSPTAYLAALLSLLPKSSGNKQIQTAIVYLLDLVTTDVPQPVLRSKFPQIVSGLTAALSRQDADAPLLRAGIGCLESLLLAQDSAAWAQPQSPDSPRGAVAALLTLGLDQRPKVRKRAQDALKNVLASPPPSPSIDHPAADLAASAALRSLQSVTAERQDDSAIMHSLQLVKAIAAAERGWPNRQLESLCEILFSISRNSSEYLTMTAFEIFETIFTSLGDELASAKLPKLLSSIKELQPSRSDSQLLPPWLAVLSRAYDVSAQLEPEETFDGLPVVFSKVADFMLSSHHNIRVSAAECLKSLLSTCIPKTFILEPSVMDEKTCEKLVKKMNDMLSVKFQSAWMEVFNVLATALTVFKWRATPMMDHILKSVGALRGNDAFAGKKEADVVIGAAIHAMGPEAVLSILPLNLEKPVKGQPGRAWLLPIMRDTVSNTNLAHFRTELVPLSQIMYQRVLDRGSEKTIDTKVFETVVNQIWACLPGYCQLPLDLQSSFDKDFAETISSVLYQQPHLRTDVCTALQNLVDTNRAIAELDQDDDLVQQGRLTKADAASNLQYLATLSSNLLAVLFNVYSQTLPQDRGNLLQCVDAFLGITSPTELMETFERVAALLDAALASQAPQTQASKDKEGKHRMPPTSHTLMDLIITMSVHLPRESFAGLFSMAANIVSRKDDVQLQKKAYKLIPRLSASEAGQQAIQERNSELQQLLLNAAQTLSSPAKRDRLMSIAELISTLPQSDLHFIPAILPEVVMCVKESNEKTRTAAFNLLVLMGQKMSEGGEIANSKVPDMPADAPTVQASLEEYFTMMTAGLAGPTPHKTSASITAITRLLFEFREQLSDATMSELVQTMDLFLTSNDREIVRSVLGFVKVGVISLPSDLIKPRLKSLVPHLVVWSHEHKQHFKAKVKHLFERMIRRFGVQLIEQLTPESDRKLITNIRKTRERRKRKQQAGDEGDEQQQTERRRGQFEDEYEAAIYGSESDQQSDVSEDDRDHKPGRKPPGGRQYIVEDEDEPLDLLDKKALAHVSSTKPTSAKKVLNQGKAAKKNIDGKLIFNDNSNDEAMDFDDDGFVNGQEPGDGSLEGGINAYIDALKGPDAPRRGPRGKLKFKQKDSRNVDEMDVDEDDFKAARQKVAISPGQHRNKQQGQRKGLGMEKQRGVSVKAGVRKPKIHARHGRR